MLAMSPNQPSSTILNVMFVDDEPGLCLLFVDAYQAEGVSVSTYSNPFEAIAAANRQQPDLVFLDFRMPDINGDLVAQAMPTDIPKYLITGDIRVETKTKFLGIFEKPLNFDAIGVVIDAARRAKVDAAF